MSSLLNNTVLVAGVVAVALIFATRDVINQTSPLSIVHDAFAPNNRQKRHKMLPPEPLLNKL